MPTDMQGHATPRYSDTMLKLTALNLFPIYIFMDTSDTMFKLATSTHLPIHVFIATFCFSANPEHPFGLSVELSSSLARSSMLDPCGLSLQLRSS